MEHTIKILQEVHRILPEATIESFTIDNNETLMGYDVTAYTFNIRPNDSNRLENTSTEKFLIKNINELDPYFNAVLISDHSCSYSMKLLVYYTCS